MSAGMPELGSKISLISKADIRYEGRLFTVDPQECTIALANVRSYGTEDRETLCPVAPQSQVYEYILFRGNDIKDIRVLNNVPSMPNDPAIMQMSAPPSLGGGGMPPNQFGGQFSLPMVGQSQFPQYHPMAGFPVGMHSQMNKSSELPSVDLGPQPQPITGPIGSGIGHHANQVKDQGSMLEMLGGGNNSRSGTPGLGHRKSPTVDQGVQCQGGPSGAGNQQRDSRRGSNTVQRQPQQQQQQRQEPQQQRNNRTNSNNRQRYPSGSGSSNAAQSSGPSGSSGHYQNQNHQSSQHHNQLQRDREHPSQHPNQHLNQPNQHLNQANQHLNQPNQHLNQMQNQHQGMRNNQHMQQGMGINQGGNYNRGGWRGGRARGRGRGGFVPRTNNKLKFDKDYDFEQANTEFEELRNQLAKAKIADGDDVVVVDGDVKPVGTGGEGDKKDDSGNETGAGEPEVEDDPYTGYDKAKSFFDNISCDAVERSKGRSQRTDWRKERKLNSETFGVASARRGAWRGRGNNWRQPPHHQPWRPMRGGGGPQHNNSQHNNSQNRDNRVQAPQPRVNQSNNQGAPRPRNNQQPAEIVAAAK